MTIEQYIEKNFDDTSYWFEQEVNKPYHSKRTTDAIQKINYLRGIHNVRNREDAVYKGKELITRKTIIQYAKTVLRFHDTYLVGNPITLTGNEDTVKNFRDIYKLGHYDSVDYKVVDHVNKFGDAYEVIYIEDGVIKSKILSNTDCYPVYSDLGEYLAFIEKWTDAYSNIDYFNVYYPTYVERWSNEGGAMNMYDSAINVCGLPIHYHNNNDEDELYGTSMLNDLMPLLDELEDVYSKLGDAIYVNSLNPLNVSTGVRLDSAIPADATGYVLNMENGGDFKVVSTTMDYNNIKYYVESLRTMINEIGCVPAVLSNTEVSNISEMSMKMLFHLAGMMAMENEKWMDLGLQERFNRWRKILGLQGMNANDEVEVVFNLAMPVDANELYSNLEKMYGMGAISTRTVMECSDVVRDADVELARLQSEEAEKVDKLKESDIEDKGEENI